MSTRIDLLESVESSGQFTNFGPMVRRFEMGVQSSMFADTGAVMTVNNATTGLMIAIAEALDTHCTRGRRYALMPSFTFAATAHAAVWAGLTPLLCDIDPDTLLPCPDSEDALLMKHGDDIAVIMPYATFGNALDLDRYLAIRLRTNIPVVVDAAPCLGCEGTNGRQFGAGQPLPVVYSLHTTKIFSTGEGGLIYSSDVGLIDRLRAMSNFGFTETRVATLPGLNAKLSEYAAVQAIAQLEQFPEIVTRRKGLVDRYAAGLPHELLQKTGGRYPVYQFFPLLCPSKSTTARDRVIADLATQGIGSAKYFSPSIHQQPYFAAMLSQTPLPVTEEISARILSLPLSDTMTFQEVDHVLEATIALFERLGC